MEQEKKNFFYKKIYQYDPETDTLQTIWIELFHLPPHNTYHCKTCLEEFLEEDSDESLSDDQQ